MILLCSILWENGRGKGKMMRRRDEGYTLLANDRYATMLQLERFNELEGDALAFIVWYRVSTGQTRESMGWLKLFTLAAFFSGAIVGFQSYCKKDQPLVSRHVLHKCIVHPKIKSVTIY